jgi:phospholipid/cholesterol/gamma-HCH transport system substrate-binding protein
MQMKLSKEFKVGLFMVMAIVLLYFGFYFLKGVNFFTNSHTYYAFYDNVDNLTPSNQVRLNGLAVGRVRDIQIQQTKNRVLVVMEIDSDIVLGDSTVAILNGELLGTRFIQLDVGNLTNPRQPKDTLKSKVAKGIADFLAESAAPVADNLTTTFRKINTILDALARNTGRLDTMFIRLQATPLILNKTLNTANSNIDQLGASYKSVAESLNVALADLKPTLENFRVLSDSLKQIQLKGTIDKAQQALTKLDNAIAKFNTKDNTMGKLMNDDEVYINLNKLLISLDSLATHFNENPRHFMSPLGKSRKKIVDELEKQKRNK